MAATHRIREAATVGAMVIPLTRQRSMAMAAIRPLPTDTTRALFITAAPMAVMVTQGTNLIAPSPMISGL